MFHKILMEKRNCINGFAPRIHFLKGLNEIKGLFFFESVGVLEGSPELGKGNSGWVPSTWYRAQGFENVLVF